MTDPIEAAARYVLENSRRGTSTNAEQFDADTSKLMTAYRDIIGKAVASGFLSTPATLDNTAVERAREWVERFKRDLATLEGDQSGQALIWLANQAERGAAHVATLTAKTEKAE